MHEAKEVYIPFTLTAAQVNALDAAGSGINEVGVALGNTLPTNSKAVRVPVRLELSKAAGTAYSLTTSLGRPLPLNDANDDPDNTAKAHSLGAHVEVYNDFATGTHPVMFRVPAIGFLDSALAQKRLALPLLSGRTFRPGATSWRMRITCPIASGTGSLTGRLVFKEYFVGD